MIVQPKLRAVVDIRILLGTYSLLLRYILQAFEWARKYGLRINLDLHTIPGSQNGIVAT